MLLQSSAIILSVRQHGEHGSIVRALTRESGVQAGYVRGGRSRRIGPALQPANLVIGEWRARTDEQLAGLTVELVHSRAPLYAEPLAAVALEWIAAVTVAALPEALPYPVVYDALGGTIGAIEAAPGARGWAAALVRYEVLLLAELGFGLDLARCTVTGTTDDLVWVSPRTGAAVSRGAAQGHEGRLLALPSFLSGGSGDAGWADVLAGLAMTGHFLERDLLVGAQRETLAARGRLIDRIKRAVA